MAEKKEYRSAIRSRKLIRQAFLELLKEKKFEKITVTDIVKKAEINRSTFYAHYPDVMGVLDEIQDEVLSYTEQLSELFVEKIYIDEFFDNPMPLLQEIVKLVEDNQELYRLLSNSNIAVKQLEQLKTLLIEQMLKTYDVFEKEVDYFQFEFSIRFFMGGIVDIYTQWLNGTIQCSSHEITEQIAKLVIKVSEDFK